MSNSSIVKVRFTQTQLKLLEEEALLKNKSIMSLVRSIVRDHQAKLPKQDGNPYLRGLERNGIPHPECRLDEK